MIFTPESIKSLFIQTYYNQTLLASATAFVVKNKEGSDFLVTNRHNLTGLDQNTGKPVSKTGGLPNNIKIHYHIAENVESSKSDHDRLNLLGLTCKTEQLYKEEFDPNLEEPIWFEHPVMGAKADFVALRLTDTNGVTPLGYDLYQTTTSPRRPKDDLTHFAEDIRVGPAENVSVIGFPFGIIIGNNMAVWATGSVASEPEENYNDLPVFLIDCRSRQGQSGSPVIAYRHGGVALNQNDGNPMITDAAVYRFMGIYSGRINSESDIGMVWKASALRELIESIPSL